MSRLGLEARIPPPIVLLLFAALMFGLARALPQFGELWPPLLSIAIVLAMLGVGIAVSGVREFSKKQTTVNPLTPDRATELVVSGIFNRTRNPMYLGLLFVLTGYAVYLANGAALLVLPLFVAYLTRYQIVPEERAMHELFGARFKEYCLRVRRWI